MKTLPIGELTEAVKTWNPSRDPDVEFEYIDLSAVDNASKEVAAATTVTGAKAPSRARQLVCAGDVLVSTVRPNLNAVAVVPPELDGATASTGFTLLRPASGLDGRFLFHWVRSPAFVTDMVRKATGASYPAVSDRIVKDSAIPLPALPEQRRIAAIGGVVGAPVDVAQRRQTCKQCVKALHVTKGRGRPRVCGSPACRNLAKLRSSSATGPGHTQPPQQPPLQDHPSEPRTARYPPERWTPPPQQGCGEPTAWKSASDPDAAAHAACEMVVIRLARTRRAEIAPWVALPA